jgi:hypothetical protein
MIVRFLLVCLGTGMFVGGLGLSLTGVGALAGLPMIAVGFGLVEANANGPRRA